MNRTIAFALLLPLALAASPLRVDRDHPDRWEATWTLGAWRCDSSTESRSILATQHAPSLVPGSLVVPVAEATVALPPGGTWSVEVQRLDPIDVPGKKWARASGWASNPIRTVPVPASTPPAWRIDSSFHGKLLRLEVPWAEPTTVGMRLARRLKVIVHMSGTGNAPLAAPLRPLVANPIGAARFGIAPPAARRLARQETFHPDGKQSILLTVREPEVGDRTRDGMVRITGTQLQSLLGSLSGIDFDRVAVGAAPLGALARTVSADRSLPGLPTIPIRRVDRDNDGDFDPQDHIEFFVQGPSFWTPDSLLGDGLFQLEVHRWDMARRYLIRLDAPQGSPEISVAKSPSNAPSISQVVRPVWAGKHLQLRVPEIGSPVPSTTSGASWFWHWAESTVLDSAALRHSGARDLPGLVGSQGTAVVRFALHSPGASDTFRVVGSTASEGTALENRRIWNLSGLRASDNRWTWRTQSSSNDFESYTIHYPYAPRRTAFHPFPAPTPGAFSLPVPGASESDSVYAVVGGIAVRAIGLTGGVLRDSATTRDTWYHFAGTNPSVELSLWKAPTAERSLSPAAMASRPRVDLLVVAPDSFLDLASQYAGFRADGRRHRVFTPGIVRTEDLWLLWGHGSQDPLAVRELIRTAVAEWGTTHVLLLGGGHYDPRGVTGASPSPIPVWQDEDIGTDAILTFLAPGSMTSHTNTQDVALGRIPARSRNEVVAWFQKLKMWEDPASASPGPWRNTYLSVADDMEVRSGGGSPDGIYGENGELGHTHSAERVANKVITARPGMTLRKVYEVEYPMNAALEKPDAQRALIDQLNRGVSAFMYLGHGGYDILADERILDTRSALLGLTNASTPFIFYAGSCTVGRHELVDARGLSEALLVNAGKGAVATISGTRPSYPENNEDLARAFWKQVLTPLSDGRAPTLGEAFQNAQNSFAAGSIDANRLYSNSSVYNLLGDPAMVPYPGGSPITLDNPPDTLAALDTYDFVGAAESQVQLSLNTRPSLQTATYSYGGRNYQQSYLAPGRTLVAVRTRADANRYKAHLLTPARLPQGDTAIVNLYSWNPSTLKDGTALDSQVVLFGIGDNPPDDRVGPRIRILPCDSSWTAGQPFGKVAEVPVPFCLNISFEDSSGISGSDAPDDGIILSVPGTLPAWHPTQIGEGADFTQAWTRLSLDAETFKPGKSYTLNVFARDLMGNASTASIELRTRAAGEIDLYEVFNRPNPAKGEATTFYFKLLADADSNGTIPQTVQASIRIHTLSGKLVRILQTDLTDVGHPRPRAVWDLKDAFRNEVANGLYPYSVLLRVRDPNTRNWRQTEKRGIVAVSR